MENGMKTNISFTIKDFIGYFFSGTLTLLVAYRIIGNTNVDIFVSTFLNNDKIENIFNQPVFLVILVLFTYFIGHANIFISFRIIEIFIPTFNRNKFRYDNILEKPILNNFESHVVKLLGKKAIEMQSKSLHLYVTSAIEEELPEFKRQKQEYEAYVNLTLCSILPLLIFGIINIFSKAFLIALFFLLLCGIMSWRVCDLRKSEDRYIYTTFTAYFDTKKYQKASNE